MEYSLGIDLGTTYSAAATARGDRLEIFQLGQQSATIPSIVVLRSDGEVLTGEAAEHRALAEPTRTGREFKRRLGDPTPIILGGTPYGAEALLAHLLRGIVVRVSEQLGGPPAAIALCHPASYGEYKIDLLRQAVRQADIGTVSLLTEPEAAAVDYARQERVPAGTVIAVYDFGGGTFDATILRKTETGFEQLGRPEGMERLGGIDFDEALFTRAMTMVKASGVELDADDPATRAALARLREECRRAKEALSSDTDATIQIFLPGHPAGDAPDPSRIRGDGPAAHPRDDPGAGTGGPQRGLRVRGSRSRAARGRQFTDPARGRDGPRGDRQARGGGCAPQAHDGARRGLHAQTRHGRPARSRVARSRRRLRLRPRRGRGSWRRRAAAGRACGSSPAPPGPVAPGPPRSGLPRPAARLPGRRRRQRLHRRLRSSRSRGRRPCRRSRSRCRRIHLRTSHPAPRVADRATVVGFRCRWPPSSVGSRWSP